MQDVSSETRVWRLLLHTISIKIWKGAVGSYNARAAYILQGNSTFIQRSRTIILIILLCTAMNNYLLPSINYTYRQKKNWKWRLKLKRQCFIFSSRTVKEKKRSREWKDGSNLKRIRLFWIMVLYNVPNIIAYCDSAKTKYDMCVIVWVELLVKLTKSCTGINWKLGS